MRAIIIPNWVKQSIKFNDEYNKLTEDQEQNFKNKLVKFCTEKPLVSIVIPAWNEEDNILKTLYSLANNNFTFDCELIVVNNNSIDNTQLFLDQLNIKSFIETTPGIGPTRHKGLINAKGKYILCCDSDTMYPPTWIQTMIKIFEKHAPKGVTAIFGGYSLFPTKGHNRILYAIHEELGSIARRIKHRKRKYLAVFGFNFGFLRDKGIETNGFILEKPRVGINLPGTPEFVAKSEDGVMAKALEMRGGKLLYVRSRKVRVWTSDRRLLYEGSFMDAIKIRVKKYLGIK
nr:glycosyltransferase family 2 protein [Bacteroidota bacterium]